jgi:hypothetical protein
MANMPQPRPPLAGEFAVPERSLLGALGAALAYGHVAIVLAPFFMLGVMCIMVGLLALDRGDKDLLVCLPAGVAIIGVMVGAPFLVRWLYPPIARFEYDGAAFTHWRRWDADPVTHAVHQIKSTFPCTTRRGVWGYMVKFHDRSRVFVNRAMPNAEALYRQLDADLAALEGAP